VLEHIRPISPWFDHSLDPPLGNGFMAGTVPDHRADGEPAKCPESLCPMRVLPHWGDALSVSSENITSPLSLIRTHSPVAACSPLLRFRLVEGVFAGCLLCQSLLPAGPSRRYLRDSFLGCLIPYPGGPTECIYLLLPLSHRPSPKRAWVGFPLVIGLKRLLAGR